MNAHSELIRKIIDSPNDSTLRLQLADQLIAEGNPHGQVMRWQCELEDLSPADSGWYARSYRLSNLLRGVNPFLSLQRGDSLEVKITEELHAVKIDDKNIGNGSIRCGFVESYSVFDVAGLKSCETAVMQAAPLISALEFSELITPDQFSDLMSLQLLARAKALTFKKCVFTEGDFDQLFNLPALSNVKQLKFNECQFASGIEQLARTRVASQLEQLTISISRVRAQEYQSGSYLGQLLTGDHLPELRVLELDYACTLSDLMNLRKWSCLSQLRDLEMHGYDWPAATWLEFLGSDFRSLQTYRQSGVVGCPGQVPLATCPALRVLSFKGLTLDEGCMQSLSQTGPATLEQLTLSNCQLTNSALELWLQGQPLTSLSYLNLQVNQLDIDGLRKLASTPWLAGLVALKLSFNPLGDQCGAVLATSPVLKQLVFLDLSETGLGNQSAKTIFSSPQLNTLEWLNLDGNSITSQSLKTLLAPAHLTNMVALRLKSNGLWDEHKSECIQRFGKEVVDSYFLGYLV